MFQAGSGALFISIFATFSFALGGLSNPFQSTIILLCVGFIGNFQGVILSRYVGRRPLLIYGPLVSGLCLIGIGIAFTVNPIAPSSGRALVGLSCVYLWAYNSSTGPFAYVVGAEVPSQRLRSWTVGLGMSVGFVFGWLCIFTSPYFINPAGSSYIGLKTCYIWGARYLFTSMVVAER
jgi:MFS transporter, SP family, sugar:H+ symporter